jgi:pantetheine-phosphate adenylyltransferase
MTVALFGGRFNPMSVGQMDVIRNASLLYDELIVLVHDEDLRHNIVDQDKRASLVKKVIKDKGLTNVRVITKGDQSIEDIIKTNNVQTVIRGLLNSKDISTLERRIASKINDIDESLDIHYVVVTQDITGAAIRRKLRNHDTNLVDEEGRNLVPSTIQKEVIKL